MRRARKSSQQGVALLMVLIALTILGSMTADLMETNEVYLATTVNAKDAVRAEYMARSGVNLSRLLLSFQRILGSSVNFPFWQYADLVIEMFTSTDGGGMLADLAGIDLSGVEGLGLGVEDGDLEVNIIDEDSKINVNLANDEGLGGMRNRMIQQLTALMSPIEYDPLFKREAKGGQYFEREDLICEILDWADPDSDLCDMSGTEDPTVYQTLEPPYERKNAPFDSLEELHLVRGIDDDIWSAFVDPNPEDPASQVLTVWGVGKVNVNTAPTQVLFPLVCMLATDANGLNPCMDPNQIINVIQILQGITIMRTFLPFNRARDFIAAVENPENIFLMGVPGVSVSGKGLASRILTTRSTVFSLYAKGTVGRVSKRIHVVVDTRAEDTYFLNPENSVAAAGGKVLYWRME